jgi:hypothetical protein
MKNTSIKLLVTAIAIIFICGCGNLTSIIGPVLDISEMKSLVVDQFFVSNGLEDEYSDTGEFAVYLRDAATGQDMTCAGQEDGMDRLGMNKIFYAGLDIPLRSVDGEGPASSARLQAVFVEKDGEDCPHNITNGDDIIGISPEFSSEELLNNIIWASNGKAAVVFRQKDTNPDNPSPMSFSMQDGLIVDQIGLENGDDGNEPHTYYLFAERFVGSEVVEVCQTVEDDFSGVRFGNMIYAALNLQVPCFSADEPNFGTTDVRLSVWIQEPDGPKLVGETEVNMIGEIIGELLKFTNDKGFIRLRNVATVPFSARYARLEELTKLVLTSLDVQEAPAAGETLEVHLRSPKGYSVVCAGTDNQFVAVEDQVELFGWDSLDLVVVGRSDGNTCPAPLDGEYSVLAEATDLEPLDLEAGITEFEGGGGVSWTYSQ